MYAIDGLCPFGGMGGCGFNIHLSHQFKDAVAKSDIGQPECDRIIKLQGQEWLQKTGFSQYFDIENCGHGAVKGVIPSEEAKPSYSHRNIRVSWGEWGPEHISVPGNACGLDIDRDRGGFGCVYQDGTTLGPHNIDSMNQVMLLLIVFTELAYSVILLGSERESSNV